MLIRTVLNAGEVSTGGNIFINNTENILVLENSQIIAEAIAGNGGNIEITTQGYFVSSNSLASASSEFGLDGNIEITNINGDRPIESKQLLENPIDATQQITTGCSFNNNFILTGKGGVPENPRQYLRGRTIWQDLRFFDGLTDISSSSNSDSFSFDPPKAFIVEAQSWHLNQQGNIVLAARDRQSELQNKVNCTNIKQK